MEFLKRRLPTGAFGRNVAMLVGSSVLGQALLVVASPVLTRLYTPQDFGVMGVYTSLLSILLVTGSLRYEVAIPLADTDEDALHVLVLCLTIVAGLALFLAAVILGWKAAFLRLVNRPEMGGALWFLPVSFLGAGCYQALSYWAMRQKAFTELARTKVAQAAGQAVTQVGLGVLGLKVGGLIIGDAVGRMAGSSTLAAGVLRSRAFRQGLRWERIRAMAWRFRRFPLISSFSAVINSGVLQLPPLLVVAAYGTREGGWFALGQNFVALPSVLIGQAVAQVFLAEATQLRRSDPRAFRQLFFTTARRLIKIGSLPVLLGALLGPWLFSLVFGPQWREAGIYVRIMLASYLVNFVVWPLSQTLLVLERQELQIAWDIGRFVLVAVTLLVPPRLGWSARWTIGACSMAMTLTYIVFFGMCAYLVNREAGGGRAEV